MKYRYVNSDEVRSGVRKQDALQAEQQAFVAEVEARRTKTDGDLIKRAADLRKMATKRCKEEGVTDEEVAAARVNWLEQWVRGMEADHVGHVTQIDLKKARGEDTAVHDSAIKVIEASHAHALKELDTLLLPNKPNRASKREDG